MNEQYGRAVSRYPGYSPLACGDCHLEVFRATEVLPGSHFRLYLDERGLLRGELAGGNLERIRGPVVCVQCEERRGKAE